MSVEPWVKRHPCVGWPSAPGPPCSCSKHHVRSGWAVVQRRMWPHLIVVDPPGLDLDLRLLQREEDLPIQQFVPELCSEAAKAFMAVATDWPWTTRTST